MRSIPNRRSLDEIVDDIATALDCDADDVLRTTVVRFAEIARVAKEHWRPIDIRAVRRAARNPVKALDAMDEALRVDPPGMPKGMSKYALVRLEVEPLQKLDGPDPRFDVLHWECAEQADRLIKRYGRTPVQTLGGNAHRITQYLVEIATDGAQRAALEDDSSGLLWVARKVQRLRKNLPAT
jgi:hypothetical protein